MALKEMYFRLQLAGNEFQSYIYPGYQTYWCIGMSSSRVSVMVCNLVTSTDLGAGAEVRQYEGRPAPAPQGGGRGQQGQLGEVDTPATT